MIDFRDLDVRWYDPYFREGPNLFDRFVLISTGNKILRLALKWKIHNSVEPMKWLLELRLQREITRYLGNEQIRPGCKRGKRSVKGCLFIKFKNFLRAYFGIMCSFRIKTNRIGPTAGKNIPDRKLHQLVLKTASLFDKCQIKSVEHLVELIILPYF